MSFSLLHSPRAVRRGLPAAGALACLAGVLLLGSPAASAADLIGHVKNADGSTTVTRDGAPKPLAAGDNLYQGDAITRTAHWGSPCAMTPPLRSVPAVR
ncbi:hypothetical protein [Insolitispirillum peregrinum]|uniref:hypothetical protein n=1 Tax=Insolitispirillum peregrinum TaxID=80876 RepID=UPI00362277AC